MSLASNLFLAVSLFQKKWKASEKVTFSTLPFLGAFVTAGACRSGCPRSSPRSAPARTPDTSKSPRIVPAVLEGRSNVQRLSDNTV